MRLNSKAAFQLISKAAFQLISKAAFQTPTTNHDSDCDIAKIICQITASFLLHYYQVLNFYYDRSGLNFILDYSK